MKKVRLMDSAWLLLESPETPMHVGIVLRFTPPADAPPQYIEQVAASLRSSATVAPPWDLVLPTQKWKGLVPLWLHDPYLDMDYHVRVEALGDENPEEALSLRVSELHGEPLDSTRPLWEAHLLHGLPDGRFALYVKVHHAVLDGVGGLRLMQRILAQTPERRYANGPWCEVAPPDKVRAVRAAREAALVDSPLTPKATPPKILPSLARAARELAKAAFDKADSLVAPYTVRACPLNRRITGARAFAVQDIPLARLKRLARLTAGTTNDIVLAVCAGAIARLLREHHALYHQPLTAAVPVSIRDRHDHGAGTAISFCLANLGTENSDIGERVTAIQASTRRAKEYFGKLPRRALVPYTAVSMLPFLVEQLSRIGGKYRPMFNVVISNVPGPRAPLYLEGAQLESAHPLSVLFHGQALNITCVRYLDTVHFGFTGCPDLLDGIEQLPQYALYALNELEAHFVFGAKESQGGEETPVHIESGAPRTPQAIV